MMMMVRSSIVASIRSPVPISTISMVDPVPTTTVSPISITTPTTISITAISVAVDVVVASTTGIIFSSPATGTITSTPAVIVISCPSPRWRAHLLLLVFILGVIVISWNGLRAHRTSSSRFVYARGYHLHNWRWSSHRLCRSCRFRR